MRKEVPGIARFMWAANGDATFGQLAPQLAPLAVGWVLGPVAAGLYAVAQRATSIIAQPAMILGQATYAEFSRLVAAGGRGAPLRKALAHSIGIGMLSSVPVILVIALCGSSIAVLIGGQAFAAAASLMLWLALARSVLIVGPTASSALVAMGRPGRSAIANIATSLGMLPFLPLMMLRWGLDAAGVHALLQAVLTSAVLITLVGITSRESASIDVAQGPGSQ
jgi:O-antigen/teichoic acid export membrane protein